MDWPVFHFTTCVATVFFAVGGIKTKSQKQHVYGALLMLGEWVASYLARSFSDSITPYILYTAIDVAAMTGFWIIMTKKRAAWAAACVIFHFLMICSHFFYFVKGEAYQHDYLTALGTLMFFCVLTIASAIITGRSARGEVLDRWAFSAFGGRTWSGLLLPRHNYS